MQTDLLLKASECVIWLSGVTLQGLDAVSTAETTTAKLQSSKSGHMKTAQGLSFFVAFQKHTIKILFCFRPLSKIAKSDSLPSTCLSARLEQLGSLWANFHEHRYLKDLICV